MITLEQARKLRAVIERLAAALTDDDAYTVPEMYAHWATNTDYHAGDRRRYNSQLYKCLQDHTSQASWTPDVSPSLWVRIDDPAQEWPEWIQPTGATDAYRLGAKVSYKNKHWINDLDYNTYAPDVYGWHEA